MISSSPFPATPIRLNRPDEARLPRIKGIRQLFRLGALLSVFAFAAVEFACIFASSKRTLTIKDRSNWLQRTCRMILRCLNVQVEYSGMPPEEGLLVCNHLSYLDIVVLGARQPISFVSKSEVQNWPVIGWLTDCAGTVYIDRENRTDVARTSAAMAEKITRGSVVCLFPEGTSSDGSTVLPFRPSLLQPAVELGWTVTPAHLTYELGDGSVEEEVCYWRDMVFGPHLLNLLGKREIRARVRYGESIVPFCNRKQLATDLRDRVQSLAASTSNVMVSFDV